MNSSEVNVQRIFERRRKVAKEAIRARKFSNEKLFLDAINFVLEGLKIMKIKERDGDLPVGTNQNQS